MSDMPKTILVVDDSATIRRIVELAFSETGIRVETAEDGSAGLSRLEALQPDLVLADVTMPEPSGYELCRHIKDSERPVPVLLLTGTFEPFDTGLAQSCGADGHLVKPFETQVLRQTVEQLLSAPPRREIPLSADEAAQLDDDRAGSSGREASRKAAPTEGYIGLKAEAGAVEAEVVDTTTAGEAQAIPVDLPEAPSTLAPRLSDEDIQRVADAVLARLTDNVVREAVRKMLPELAEQILRERIDEIETP